MSKAGVRPRIIPSERSTQPEPRNTWIHEHHHMKMVLKGSDLKKNACENSVLWSNCELAMRWNVLII